MLDLLSSSSARYPHPLTLENLLIQQTCQVLLALVMSLAPIDCTIAFYILNVHFFNLHNLWGGGLVHFALTLDLCQYTGEKEGGGKRSFSSAQTE